MKRIGKGCLAIAAGAALCGYAVSAAEWKMLVEANGATNVVTAADVRKYAIDVSVEERDGAWRGKIVNREKGAVVLGFELTSEPLAVAPGNSALYLPHVYGRRVRNWPEHGARQKGSTMWTETANGVFVPFISKYDAATGSRAVPLPYPSKLATMQWATLNDGEEGFYLASEDPLAGAKDIQIEYDSNVKRLKMGFHFPMFIPEGLSYDVPKVVMKKYAGTWRTAAKAYRAWWDTCRRVVHVPDAVRKDFTGFMMVILKQQNDQIVWPYTDFKSLGDAALAHGFRHVEFHGWGVGGHDRLYPEYDPDPAMGGRDALVKGVKALQGRGLHVSVYSNGQLQQQGGTKWYEEKGRSCPIMRRDGTTMSEYWVKFKDHPGTTFDVACPASPAWRGQMLKICRDAQALGFQGFLYDQIGKQWPSLCFDARHGHRPGAFVFAHDRETMLLDVIDAMHKVDPDFVLWSEAFNDTILDSVALYQGLFYGTDDGYNVANRFVEGNACDMFPEMTFYVFPELILTDRNSTPLCTRKRANGTAVTNLRVDFEVRYPVDRDYVERGVEPPEGYYGKIVSKPGEPKLMTKENWRTNRDYLKCVSDFRRANGDLLLCGTFKADEGFSVAGGEKVIANRWDGRNGEAGILVWNADDKPAAVKVAFGGNLLSVREPERGEVDTAEPIPPNTLRLYRYRQVAAAPSVTARPGFAAHSMLTRDGRRMVSYLDGTNTVYELVPTNQLPADLPPVREWRLYGLKATHTDIGLHNSQYIQRHGTVRRIDEAARLIDADTRADDDPAAYRYVMEGFWFWDNYHMDKGMDAAWRVVTNYVARGRMDVGVTCAGNHTHLFSKTEIDRSTLTKKLLADKWGISTRTFLMADNPGMSCSLITPYLRAGIRYGIFMPNHWNPHPSTIWMKNTAIPAATWNPDAMGGGARVEVSYDSPLPMVFRWKAPGSDDSLLMWCSTQYDHGYERLGVKRSRTPVGEVEKRMPSFLSILERKYPYDIWLAGLYGDDEWPTTGFADFAAEWNKKWAWPQFHTLGRLDEPFEHLEKKFGDKIPTLTGEMTSGWLQHAASAPELLADKLNADRMLETAERLGTFAGTIDRGAVDRAWWYLILNDEHSYGTSGYQGRRVFETWMQHRDWIERATAIASNELSKAVAKLDIKPNEEIAGRDARPRSRGTRDPAECVNGTNENRWYRIVVTNGVIYSIYDKDLKRELIDAPANRFLYTRDNHKTWETAPVAALGAEVAQRVYLPDDVKRIDIVNTFKHARDLFNTKRYYRFGYMAFPFAVPGGRFAAHLNGMTIRPYEDCHPMTTDAYFAVRDWCAVENGDFGVALMMRDSTLTEFGEIHPDKTCYTGKPPVGKSAIYPYLFTDWLQMHQPDGDSMNFTFRFAITSYATGGRGAKISQLCEDWLDPYAKWMRAHNVPRVTRETVAEPPPGWTGLIEKPRAGHGEKDGQMYLLWGAEMSPAFDHYELYRDGKFLANVTNEAPDGVPYRVARYEDLGLPTHSRHEYRLRKVWKDGRKDELGEPFHGLTRYVGDEGRRGVAGAAASLPPSGDSPGRFQRVGLDEIRLGGEFERRIMMAVTNNLLQAEIEHQFLDRFRAKARSGDSVGTGKLIETAVRFGVYTGDPRVIALKDHVVTELLKAQSPDGYIGCLRKDSRLWGYWDLAETGFIFLGLAADHRYFGSERSLAAARRAADYMIDNWHTMPPGWEDAYISGTAAAVGFPWGLHALYEETGDVKYRDFAVKARHLDTWYRPVTLGRGFGIHGHSATHLHQCLVQSLYRASGVDTPRRATDETVRFMLDGNGTLINGTCGLWECWTDDQDGRLSVGETCSTGYQLWLWDALVREGGNPEARWGDAVERTVYNALFGAQSETGRHIRYYTPLEGKRTYYPSDTYCCPNNFRRIMSELPEFTFYKSASALYANLYTSCTLKTKLASGAVEITEKTDYPTDEKIVFDVAPEKDGCEFDLVLRIPGWCERPSLAVNGEAVAAKRGTLAHVRRRWRKGDRVELTLPMRVRTVAGRRRQAGRVAFMRGPLVYALNPTLNGGGAERAEMKSSRLTAEDQRLAKRREFFALDPADVCATMLVDPASVRLVRDDTVRPNGTALRIRAATAGHATGVNEKNSTEITLTEFPDVGATATYFRVSDLSQAEEDGLFK